MSLITETTRVRTSGSLIPTFPVGTQAWKSTDGPVHTGCSPEQAPRARVSGLCPSPAAYMIVSCYSSRLTYGTKTFCILGQIRFKNKQTKKPPHLCHSFPNFLVLVSDTSTRHTAFRWHMDRLWAETHSLCLSSAARPSVLSKHAYGFREDVPEVWQADKSWHPLRYSVPCVPAASKCVQHHHC